MQFLVIGLSEQRLEDLDGFYVVGKLLDSFDSLQEAMEHAIKFSHKWELGCEVKTIICNKK